MSPVVTTNIPAVAEMSNGEETLGQWSSDGIVAAFVIDRYRGSASAARDRHHLSETADDFIGIARRLGFHSAPLLTVGSRMLNDSHGDGVAATTRPAIFKMMKRFRDHPAERKILYWTGHGEKVAEEYYLACGDSYRGRRFVKDTAITAAQLAAQLADDPADTLLILDACFSRAALNDVRRVIEAAGRKRDSKGRPVGFAVVVTAAKDEEATEGYWVSQLQKVLEAKDLDLDGYRLFHRESPFIPFGHLLNALSERAGWKHATQRHDWYEISSLRASFLHNPYCSDTAKPASRPPDDETWIGEELKDENYLVLSQRSEIWELRDFTPREAVLDIIVTWLSTRSSGLLTLTGASGAGKSALLNYVAHLTTRKFRASLPEDRLPRLQPDLYSIHAALHCRGKTLTALSDELCRRLRPLGLDPPASATPDACVEAVARVARRKGSLTLLFDGLDEAAAGHSLDIARRLLNRLAAHPSVKVLVGTRANPRRTLPGSRVEDTLLDTLHHDRSPLELDKRPEAETDIARHVEHLLSRTQSPYRSVEAVEERQYAARHIAAHSNGIFLVATLGARQLARGDGIPPRKELARDLQTGPTGLNSLLASELDLLDPEDPIRIRDLLRPLALAQGRGLPYSEIWLTMANAAKSTDSRDYTKDDLRAMLQRAEGVVIARESEFGEDVYHLHHPSFGAHLLQRGRIPQDLHREVYGALRALIQSPSGHSWADAHPYITSYLAAHAALAGGAAFSELVGEYDFLVHASPDVVEPLIATQTEVSHTATLYLTIADAFRRQTDPVARWALLRATALATPDLLKAIPQPPDVYWDDVWSSIDPLVPQRSLAGAYSNAFAVHWAEVDGGLLHVAGTGEIRTWSMADSREVRGRDTGRATWESPPALRGVTSASDGDHQVVAAHDGHTVYLWQGDDKVPTERFYWGGSVTALSAVCFHDRVYLAGVVDQGDARIWWWRRGAVGARSEINSERLPGRASCVTLLSAPYGVLAAAGGPGGITVWDVTMRGSRPGRRPETVGATIAHDQPIVAVAALTARRRGNEQYPNTWLAAMDGERLHVWLLTDQFSAQTSNFVAAPGSWHPSGPMKNATPVLTAESNGRTVALGRGPQHAILAAVREGRNIRLWPALDGEHVLLPGESQHASLAFDPTGSGRIAVADGTRVRLWDSLRDAFASATGGDMTRGRKPSKGRSLVRLSAGPGGEHLLCRAYGTDVLLTLHNSRGLLKAAQRPLRHQQPITAIAAVHTGEGWLVAAVARRSASIWTVPDDLDVLTKPSATLDLHGQDDIPVPSVDLHVVGDGTVWLVAPGVQCVRAWTCSSDGRGEWQEAANTWPFRAAATARRIAVDSFPGSPAWLYAWGGEAVRVWMLSNRNHVAHRVDTQGIRTAAFGLLQRGTQRVPLVALAFHERVEIVECFRENPERKPLAGRAAINGLTFAGPPQRPLVVGWENGSGRIRIWDAETRESVHEIKDRGYEVEAVAAVCETSGITLMIHGRVQGRVRCDQVLLPARKLADLLGTDPTIFAPTGSDTPRWKYS